MPTEEELRLENEGMKAEIAKLEARKVRTRQEQILEAAREVVVEKGFDADLRDILERAHISTTTFYRHYHTREEVIGTLVKEINEAASAKTAELLQVEDAQTRMLEFIRFAFGQFSDYGILSNQIAIGEVPAAYEQFVDSEGFWRFLGRTIKDCKAQGQCRSDVDTRVVVRTYVWLVQPFRMNWCRRDGMTDDEIAEETMDIFFSAFAADPPPGVTGRA